MEYEAEVINGIRELVAELNNHIDMANDLGLQVKIKQQTPIIRLQRNAVCDTESNVTCKIWREY